MHVLSILISLQQGLGCIQEIPKEMLQCVDILSIVTAEQHGSHIPTGMIKVHFYGYGMYLLVLIKFLYSALEHYFISKTIKCFWVTPYIHMEEVKSDLSSNL
jgi:hypothetical protein